MSVHGLHPLDFPGTEEPVRFDHEDDDEEELLDELLPVDPVEPVDPPDEEELLLDDEEARAKVGRAALDNPDLPVEFVRDTLLALEEESEPFALPEA